MESSEHAAREHIRRQEWRARLDISLSFARSLESVHHLIIARAEQANRTHAKRLVDAERDAMRQRDERIERERDSEHRRAEPLKRHLRQEAQRVVAQNRRRRLQLIAEEREAHEQRVAETMARKHAEDHRRIAAMDAELEDRIRRELSRSPVQVVSPPPVLHSPPIKLAALRVRHEPSRDPVECPNDDRDALIRRFLSPIRRLIAARPAAERDGSSPGVSPEADHSGDGRRKVKLAPISLDMNQEKATRGRVFRDARISLNAAQRYAARCVEEQRRMQDEQEMSERCDTVVLQRMEQEVERKKRSVLGVARMIDPTHEERYVGPLNVVADRGKSIGQHLQTMQEERRDTIDAIIDVESSRLRAAITAREEELLRTMGGPKKNKKAAGGKLHFPAAPDALYPNGTQRATHCNAITHSQQLSARSDVRQRLLTAMKEGAAHKADFVVDLSHLHDIGRAAWALLEEGLPLCPGIVGVDVTGSVLTSADCRALRLILLRFPQLTILRCHPRDASSVARAGAVASYGVLNDDDGGGGGDPSSAVSSGHTIFGDQGPHFGAILLSIVAQNAEMNRRRHRLDIAWAHKAQLPEIEKAEATQLPAIRKRAHFAFELLRDAIEFAESIWRQWIVKLEQGEARERIRVGMMVDRADIESVLRFREQTRLLRAALEDNEQLYRKAVEDVAWRGYSMLRDQLRDDIRRIEADQRRVLQAHASERDVFCVGEREQRLRIRREEAAWRKTICHTQPRAERALIDEALRTKGDYVAHCFDGVQRKIAAHKAELERQRLKLEKERVAAERLMAKHLQLRNALTRSEEIERERHIAAEEQLERARLVKHSDNLLRNFCRQRAIAERSAQRAEYSHDPVEVELEGCDRPIIFVQGSMSPVPLMSTWTVPTLHLRVPRLPPYMMIGPTAAEERGRDRNANVTSDPSPTRKRQLMEEQALMERDADEIGDAEWVQQKSKFLGCTATIEIEDPSPVEGLFLWSSLDTYNERLRLFADADGVLKGAFVTSSSSVPPRNLELCGPGDSGDSDAALARPVHKLTIAVPRNDHRGPSIALDAVGSIGYFADPRVAPPTETERTIHVKLTVRTPVPSEHSGLALKQPCARWERSPTPPDIDSAIAHWANSFESLEALVDASESVREIGGVCCVSAIESALACRVRETLEEQRVAAHRLPSPDFDYSVECRGTSSSACRCVVESLGTFSLRIRIAPPLWRPVTSIDDLQTCSVPLTYCAGQGDAPLLPDLVDLRPPVATKAGGWSPPMEVAVDYGPTVDPNDTLSIAVNSVLRIQGKDVMRDNVAVAMVVSGPLLTAIGSDSTAVVARRVGAPSTTILKLASSLEQSDVELLIKSLVFRNDSSAPSLLPRRALVSLRFPSAGVSASFARSIALAAVENPIDIDWRHWQCVPFYSVPVPHHTPSSVPCYLLARSVSCSTGNKSTVLDGGYLSVRITQEPSSGEALLLLPRETSRLGGIAQEITRSFDLSRTARSGAHRTTAEDVEALYDWARLLETESSSLNAVVVENCHGFVTSNADLALFGSEVVYRGERIGRMRMKSTTWMVIEFARYTLNALDAILHAIAYVRMDEGKGGRHGNLLRSVELAFAAAGSGADSRPLRRVMSVRIAAPILSVASASATLKYKEGSGPVPLAAFNVSNEDIGFDGGYLLFDIVVGCTKDDCLLILEDDAVRLIEVRPEDAAAFSDARTVSSSSRSAASTAKSQQGPSSFVRRLSSIASPKRRRAVLGGRELAPIDVPALLSKRGVGGGGVLLSSLDITGSSKDTRNIKKPASGAAVSSHSTSSHLLYYKGSIIAAVSFTYSSLRIQFDPSPYVEAVASSNKGGEDRAMVCRVRRPIIVDILRHIGFENASRNPTELHKRVRVTASDGTVHPSVCTVIVDVQPFDDATEIRRNAGANVALEFRSQSDSDVQGFTPFHGCTVHDPDTFAFNGAVLNVDVVSGGDPRGDQLGFLTQRQQRDSPLVVEINTQVNPSVVLVGGQAVGRVVMNAPLPNGMCNIRVTFAPRSEHFLPPSSHTEAQQRAARENIVPISAVEAVLQAITYTSIAAKVKPGPRVIRAICGFAKKEGVVKVTVNVQGPVLWLPEFGTTVTLRLGLPPPRLLSTLLINLPDDEVLRHATIVELRIVCAYPGEELVLDLGGDGKAKQEPLAKALVFSGAGLDVSVGGGKLERGCRVEKGRDPDDESAWYLRLVFDWTSKMTVKHLSAALRSVVYRVATAAPPPSGLRHIETSLTIDRTLVGLVKSTVRVVTGSQETVSLQLRQAMVEGVLRGGRPLRVAATATLNPNNSRTVVPAGSWLSVEVRNGVESTDLLHIQGATLPPGTTTRHEEYDDLGQELHYYANEGAALGAIITRPSRSSTRLHVAIESLTFAGLEALVRSITAQFLPNAADRATQKNIVLEIKVGATESSTETARIVVELLPPLLDLSDYVRPLEYDRCIPRRFDGNDRVTVPRPLLRSKPLEPPFDPMAVWRVPAALSSRTAIFGSALVPAQHFAEAGVLTIEIAENHSWIVIGFDESILRVNGRNEVLLVENGKKIASVRRLSQEGMSLHILKDRASKTSAGMWQRILRATMLGIPAGRPADWPPPIPGEAVIQLHIVVTAVDEGRGNESFVAALTVALE